VKRFPLATLLVINTLLVMFAIPGIFLFSAPKAGITVDVSYLKGITLAVVPLTDVTGSGDQSAGFSSLLFSELDELKVLRMVPPSKIKTAIINAGVTPGFEADFSQILKAGKNAKADIVVTGTINNYLMLNKNTSAISMSIYAINIHTGETIWSDNLTRSFEKTKFIDEGARLACTLAVKRMVEGMEKQKTAMKQSISMANNSTSTLTIHNQKTGDTNNAPIYAANDSKTGSSSNNQTGVQSDSTNDSNLKSADALLQELLGNSSPTSDNGKKDNGSKTTNNVSSVKNSTNNKSTNASTGYEQAGHLATDIMEGINKNRKQIKAHSVNNQGKTNQSYASSNKIFPENTKTNKFSYNGNGTDHSLKKENETTRIKLGTVYFPSGSAQIDSASQNDISEIVAAINANPKVPLIIEGHTDDSGTPSYNSYLAHARSNALKQYLASKGVSKNRMVTFGFSAKAPVTPNVSEENMNLNRRAVVYACPEADRMNCGGYWNKTNPNKSLVNKSQKTQKDDNDEKLYKYSKKKSQSEKYSKDDHEKNAVKETVREEENRTNSQILENMRNQKLGCMRTYLMVES